MLRGLLWQLLQDCEGKSGLKIVHDLVLAGSLSNACLLQALRGLIALFKRPVYCLIDGVDECMLDGLVNLLSASMTFHLAAFGQPLRLRPFINAAAYNLKLDFTLMQHDIVLYMQARIHTSDILMTSQHEDLIMKAVQQDPGCTFLQAKLILEDLSKSATKGEIIKRLDHLPQGLEQAYQLTIFRLLRRLDS